MQNIMTMALQIDAMNRGAAGTRQSYEKAIHTRLGAVWNEGRYVLKARRCWWCLEPEDVDALVLAARLLLCYTNSVKEHEIDRALFASRIGKGAYGESARWKLGSDEVVKIYREE